MLKYVINHKKIRGSLQTLADTIFKQHVCFLREPKKKPSEYLYVKWSEVKNNNSYVSAKEIECTDHKGNKVKVPLEKIKTQKFKISKIGKEVTDEDL